MIRKLLPLILAGVGLGGGIAAGVALRPTTEAKTDAAAGVDVHAKPGKEDEGGHNDKAADHKSEAGSSDHAATDGPEYVKLNNQFVVPVVEEGRVQAMVVLSLSLEVEAGLSDSVYEREPKLRDVFLQVLFDHANSGGFSGSFTDGANLVVLRTGLQEAGALVLGDMLKDVLITDIARQDS